MKSEDRERRKGIIIGMYQEGRGQADIGRHFGMSRQAVNQIIKRYKEKHGIEKINVVDVIDEYKKDRKKADQALMNFMFSKGYNEVIEDAVGLLSVENLKKDFKERGLANAYRVAGMLIDKRNQTKEFELKERQLAIREREVEIKEKELELRISNPEAFQEVHIINDAPKEEERATS